MRAVSAGQTQNISKAGALGSIVLERGFDGLVISLTPLIVLVAVDLPNWVVRINLAFLAVYGIGLAALGIATERGWTEGWITWTAGRLPIRLSRVFKSLSREFLQGMKGINHHGALLPVILLSFACWFVHGLYFFLIFSALDIQLSFSAALVLQTIIGIGVICRRRQVMSATSNILPFSHWGCSASFKKSPLPMRCSHILVNLRRSPSWDFSSRFEADFRVK